MAPIQHHPLIHMSPNRATMAREVEAYKKWHPSLVQQLLGQYVAIYQGQLVDQDLDEDALITRVRRAFPKKTILVRQVEVEPDREIYVSSFRLGNY